MSLLMQALKKAEHAKQKKSAAAENEAPRQAPAPASTPETVENPMRARSRPATPEPEATATRASARRPEPARKEPEFSLSDIEPPSSSLTLQPLALSGPSIEAESPPPISTPFQQNPPVPDSRPETSESSAPQPSEAPPKPARPSAPRAEEQKQAAMREAEKIGQAQQKAKSVFAAKQAPRSSRPLRIVAGAMVAAIMCAGAGFYYWQTSSQDTEQARLAALRARNAAFKPALDHVASTDAATVAAGATLAPDAASTPVAGSSVPADKPAPTSQTASSSATADPNQTAAVAGKPTDKDVAGAAANGPSSSETPMEHPITEHQREQAAQIAAADKIQIRKSAVPAATNPALSNAYRLFTSGDLNGAHPLYESVLRDDPNNRDALLGLAAIALNRNQTSQAAALYSRLLDRDPSDPDAIAGLTSVRNGDLEQSESILKKVLAQNPQSGATLFELGNLYARQSRWSDAQQSYFRAYTTAPGNADYAFNLAISLDRLGQSKLALEYYRQALSSARNAPSRFTPSVAQDRIDKLLQAMRETHIE